MRLRTAAGSALRGEVGPAGNELPGDKSLSHRAALFAALAEGESQIENFQVSGVTRPMLEALTALDVPWTLEGKRLTIQGQGLRRRSAQSEAITIHCGNSATTLRLLAGAIAARGDHAILDGTPGLRRRPMGRIVEPLQSMGVAIAATGNCAPLVLQPSPFPLQPLNYRLPVASAQVKSCLLLAALAGKGVSMVSEPGPSRDHTERMLRNMGVAIETVVRPGESYTTRLQPPQPLVLAPLNMTLPGDISAAAFLIVAAAIVPGSHLTLRQVGLNPTRTGLLEALRRMGASIQIQPGAEQGGEPAGDVTVTYHPLHGTQVSGDLVVRMIDEFPVFAVAAACAQGTTTVREAGELRYKESDRISVLCEQLRQLGVTVEETADGFTVGGGAIHGGTVNSRGDHRLAMALAVAGLVAERPVEVEGAEMMTESFPNFDQVLRTLGATVRTEI